MKMKEKIFAKENFFSLQRNQETVSKDFLFSFKAIQIILFSNQ